MHAPEPDATSGLAFVLDDWSDRYRLVALYTIDADRLPDRADDDHDLPISVLFHGSRFETFYARRSSMFPTCSTGHEVDEVELGLPPGVEVCRARWLLLRFPSGTVMGALGLSFSLRVMDASTRAATLVELRQRLDAERSQLPLGGAQTALGPDFHQVLMLPSSHAAEFGLDPFAEDAQRLVSTKTDGVRPTFQSARMPRDANRYLGTVAAVTPGASVLGGQDEHVQRACLVAAMQAIAALASLRSTFDRAYAELASYRSAAAATGSARLDRANATRLAEEIRGLQLDLSFEVESQQEVRLAVPLLPVEDFHAELAESLGMARASSMTSRMVERLAAALDAELGRLSLEEAAESTRRSHRVESWLIGLTMFATISVPITLILALLGSNVREVTAADGAVPSIWEMRFVPYYVALVAAPTVAGLTAWLVSRRVLQTEGGPEPTTGVE